MQTHKGNTLIPALAVILSLSAAIGVFAFSIWPKDDEFEITTPVVKTNSDISDTNANGTSNANAVPATNTSTAETTSPGLWFPFNEGQTVNNSRPVIYGKVSQSSDVYLSTTFTSKDWPGRDNYGAKTLTFAEGAVKKVNIQLDGQTVTGVVGFPQFPSVLCVTVNYNPDGSKTTDENTNQQIPADTIYTSEAECRKELASSMPPLIFVFRPAQPLTMGEHILTVNGTAMKFGYDPSTTVPVQSIPSVDKTSFYNNLDVADNCSPGYYQDAAHMTMALPNSSNKNLFWGLSFPQSEAEKGSINRRHVELSLAGQQFPLFFPGSTIYFEGKKSSNRIRVGDFGLFVPLKHLVYSDGKAASLWGQKNADLGNDYITDLYSEIYPLDISGREYRGRAIPWSLSTNSGCDG